MAKYKGTKFHVRTLSEQIVRIRQNVSDTRVEILSKTNDMRQKSVDRINKKQHCVNEPNLQNEINAENNTRENRKMK